MKQVNYKSARDALIDLDGLCVRMQNALDLLYAVYAAENQGDLPHEFSANAIFGAWDYMCSITRDIEETIKAGIQSNE